MKRLIIIITAIIGLSACQQHTEYENQNLKEKIEMEQEIAVRNKTNALAFLKALENKDLESLVDLFAVDGKHINPYASGLFSEGTEGPDGIRAYWEPVFPNFKKMEFPVDEIYAMEDPNLVYVKFKGKIELLNDAGWYENDYYATFKFNESGKITEYTEIFNPIAAARGFGLLDKIK